MKKLIFLILLFILLLAMTMAAAGPEKTRGIPNLGVPYAKQTIQ